jgi:hypothetical protein
MDGNWHCRARGMIEIGRTPDDNAGVAADEHIL